jgi:yecA family protein
MTQQGESHEVDALYPLDGFLAALLCGPDEVPQSEYLREIWRERNEDAFTAQPILQDFAYLITRHRDAMQMVGRALRGEKNGGTVPASTAQ